MTYRVRVMPKKKRRKMSAAKEEKKTLRGLQLMESSLTFPVPKEGSFSGLPRNVLKGLAAISTPLTFPKGALLFAEGQEPQGIFILRSGRAKLIAGSSDGTSLMLRIASPGDVVGLPGTISRKPCEVTAEAVEPIQANFIPRSSFLGFLRKHSEAALRVAEILSEIYHATYREVRYLGFSGSAAERLARFLVDVAASKEEKSAPIRVGLSLTHQEIAGTIGTSRETVTRLLATFKRKRFIETPGSTLVITNKLALKRLSEA
jgi:CRP/FNR family transcriptional regulator, cyclic AMP receptor protein